MTPRTLLLAAALAVLSLPASAQGTRTDSATTLAATVCKANPLPFVVAPSTGRVKSVAERHPDWTVQQVAAVTCGQPEAWMSEADVEEAFGVPASGFKRGFVAPRVISDAQSAEGTRVRLVGYPKQFRSSKVVAVEYVNNRYSQVITLDGVTPTR